MKLRDLGCGQSRGWLAGRWLVRALQNVQQACVELETNMSKKGWGLHWESTEGETDARDNHRDRGGALAWSCK